MELQNRFSPAKSFLVYTISSFLISCFLISRLWFHQYPTRLRAPGIFTLLRQCCPPQTIFPTNNFLHEIHRLEIMNIRNSRLSIITGLDYWNRLLERTTGLTFFALKIIFMPSNKICLPCILHYKAFQHDCLPPALTVFCFLTICR